MNLRIFVLGLLFRFSLAIFEDQAGKFDWRKQFVGCPTSVRFDRAERGSDRLILTTREDLIASLSLNTGEIAWRKLMEKRDEWSSNAPIATAVDEDNIYSVVDSGRILRVWRKADSALVWQKVLSDEPSKTAEIALFDNTVFAAVDSKIGAFSLAGDEKYAIRLSGAVKWTRFLKSGGRLFHVKLIDTQLTARELSAKDSDPAPGVKSVTFTRFNVEKCTIAGSLVLCAHSDTLVSIDVSKALLVEEEKNTAVTIREITGSATGFAAIRSPSSLKVFKGLTESFTINGEFTAANFVDEKYLVAVSSSDIVAYELANGKEIFQVKHAREATKSLIKALWAAKTSNDWEVVLVGHDCLVEYVVVEPSKNLASVEWTSEEALARIATVEMVDLPLSESQQMIEDEFEGGKGDLFSAFFHRIVTQIGQLRKWALRSVRHIFTLGSRLSSRANGFSDIINAVRSASSSDGDNTFERDYFNLRKVIVVSTFDGVVFGIDSATGAILWRFYLGQSFSPLKSQLGDFQVPLMVQRTTAHYQLHGQAAVVFRNSVNSKGVIVMFNPIDGKIVSRKELDGSIKRVSLLPYLTNDHIHPLLVLEYVPELAAEVLSKAAPLYVLDVSVEENIVKGLKVNLLKRHLSTTWSGSIGLTSDDKIIAVKGKPFQQKVHSQGRVVIDRTVQYKYVNPNLAAVAALDEKHQTLSIVLLDIVSGQIVHSAIVPKAAAPIHLVHSEHWLAYAYWSEKGRRTEVGIVELYEGGEQQSMAETFDSMAPTKQAPVSIAQSYIYAQGIVAMSVTETEQGLTTRSILVGLPDGGVHEISRKILDATRPLELTQEMREEMMIGYVPEIMIPNEEMINYNQSVHRVHGIKTAPSGLESTSLVLAYGTDVFFTRLAPSGTFDILKDDFDHVFISIVLAALVIGSFVSKRLARSHALNAQWA
ncbi:unnamed protein product [Caenorhabditis auriculariae]|uniref:ER membrane protein complex subunit 1 n=1 Tax=Caenorhabditis auriculariae TaxID=2777116 RepID=A0A8S1HQJ3_9PELO|nr:unnamed protein product [Caenorhabditis auriculariae]